MAYEPPGRIRAGEDYATGDAGRGPLAWLRENGRYLTPTGAGDLLYGVVLAIRNWLAVHYVIGTLFVFGLSAIALARASLMFVDSVPDYEYALLPAPDGGHWWWSLLWWLPIAMVAVWLVFTLMLFVLEPLVLHRLLERRAARDPEGTYRLVERLHVGLLAASLLTIAGVIAGVHGGWP